MKPVTRILNRDRGNRNFHPKCINWSYLNLGKVDLIQIKKNRQQANFIINQTTGGRNGPCHPPRKNVTASADTVIIFAYSAIKNIANFILLYSV